MSVVSQYIDRQVLESMPADLRKEIERHFAVGVKRVDLRLAKMRVADTERALDVAEAVNDFRLRR